MGLFKTLFRYGLGTTLSKNHKELSGIAYATTMNYLETLNKQEQSNIDLQSKIKKAQNSMLKHYDNNKNNIGSAFRDKYFNAIKDLDKVDGYNNSIYTTQAETAIRELKFFSLLCSGAMSIVDGLKEVSDDLVSKESKKRVSDMVERIWNTSDVNVGLMLFDEFNDLLSELRIGIPNAQETRTQLTNSLKEID